MTYHATRYHRLRGVGICILALLVPLVAFADKGTTTGTFTTSGLLIHQPPPVKYLLVTNNSDNPEPVFSVAPDGTTYIRGVNVAQMSSDEAKVAMVTLTRWILSQQQEESMLEYLGHQTDYLLAELDESKEQHRSLSLQLSSCLAQEQLRKALEKPTCTVQCHGE